MGFCSLQHGSESMVHLARALPARYVPPSGFGHPLDGLLPSNPCRFSLTPAALLGFTLRSFLLPARCSERFHPNAPTYRFSCRYTQCRSTWPARQAAVPGVSPFRESLAVRRVFSTPATGCSLGFRPLRVLEGGLDRDFARSPLTRFTRRPDRRATPQSINRHPPSSHPAPRTSHGCG